MAQEIKDWPPENIGGYQTSPESRLAGHIRACLWSIRQYFNLDPRVTHHWDWKDDPNTIRLAQHFVAGRRQAKRPRGPVDRIRISLLGSQMGWNQALVIAPDLDQISPEQLREWGGAHFAFRRLSIWSGGVCQLILKGPVRFTVGPSDTLVGLVDVKTRQTQIPSTVSDRHNIFDPTFSHIPLL